MSGLEELERAKELLEDASPSGLTHIEEMRRFAAGLDREIGPLFGRDVVRVLDVLVAAVETCLRRDQELREAMAALDAWGWEWWVRNELGGVEQQ